MKIINSIFKIIIFILVALFIYFLLQTYLYISTTMQMLTNNVTLNVDKISDNTANTQDLKAFLKDNNYTVLYSDSVTAKNATVLSQMHYYNINGDYTYFNKLKNEYAKNCSLNCYTFTLGSFDKIEVRTFKIIGVNGKLVKLVPNNNYVFHDTSKTNKMIDEFVSINVKTFLLMGLILICTVVMFEINQTIQRKNEFKIHSLHGTKYRTVLMLYSKKYLKNTVIPALVIILITTLILNRNNLTSSYILIEMLMSVGLLVIIFLINNIFILTYYFRALCRPNKYVSKIIIYLYEIIFVISICVFLAYSTLLVANLNDYRNIKSQMNYTQNYYELKFGYNWSESQKSNVFNEILQFKKSLYVMYADSGTLGSESSLIQTTSKYFNYNSVRDVHGKDIDVVKKLGNNECLDIVPIKMKNSGNYNSYCKVVYYYNGSDKFKTYSFDALTPFDSNVTFEIGNDKQNTGYDSSILIDGSNFKDMTKEIENIFSKNHINGRPSFISKDAFSRVALDGAISEIQTNLTMLVAAFVIFIVTLQILLRSLFIVNFKYILVSNIFGRNIFKTFKQVLLEFGFINVVAFTVVIVAKYNYFAFLILLLIQITVLAINCRLVLKENLLRFVKGEYI